MEDRPILKLNQELIGKIAAGEVVESPASAIKELAENSLDAGATCVTVEIRDGGIAYLRVTDNGRGIRARDVRMAFERHATSKITKSDDLFVLHTLGFRGEALASIAAVSKLTITTRSIHEETGTRAINEGGEIKSITEAASPQGTTIVARELFYNTPVRLKFLKKPATEAAKVAEMIARLILAHPDVSFRLIHNGKQIYASSGNGDLRSAVFSLYGREIAGAMIAVKSEGAVAVSGLVGVGPDVYRQRAHHPQSGLDAGAGGRLPRARDHRTLSHLRIEHRDADEHGGRQRAPQQAGSAFQRRAFALRKCLRRCN